MEAHTSKLSPDSIRHVDSAVNAVFASHHLDKGVEEFRGKLGGLSDQELTLAIGRFEYRTETGDFNAATASVKCVDGIIDELGSRGSRAIQDLESEKRRNLGKLGRMVIEMAKDPENQRSFESLRGCARSLENTRLLFEGIGDSDGAKEASEGIKEIMDTVEDEAKREAIASDSHRSIAERRRAISGLDGYRSRKLLEAISENRGPELIRLRAIGQLEMPSRSLLEELSKKREDGPMIAGVAQKRLASLRYRKAA